VFFWLARVLRRRRLAQRAMPAGWPELAAQKFPFLSSLAADERERFLVHLKVFGLEKSWEGAKGLVVTDEMKVVVSGAAARLSRNVSLDAYDELQTVLLYDSSWVGRDSEAQTLGEAHRRGLVILAWDAVQHGLARHDDGRDVALHELAHALDISDGDFDGTPRLHAFGDYRAWAQVFHAHFRKLQKKPHANVLDAYGATNEAEFFAVATETFFEKPGALQRKAPELYAELKRFYRTDPAANARPR
jgi:MtfA peptidase